MEEPEAVISQLARGGTIDPADSAEPAKEPL